MPASVVHRSLGRALLALMLLFRCFARLGALLPDRILWTLACAPGARPRWTSVASLVTGAPARALASSATADPVAVVAWHGGALVRAVCPGPLASELSAARQRAALACLFGDNKTAQAARLRGRHVLGVTHNHFDVTHAVRPWMASIASANSGLTPEAVAVLLRRTAGARRHVVELLWDTLDETCVEGRQPLVLA